MEEELEGMEMKGSKLIKGTLEAVTFEVEENIDTEGVGEISDETKIVIVTLKIDGRDVFVLPSFKEMKIGEIPPIFSVLEEGEKRIIIIKVRKLGSSFVSFDFDFKNALVSSVIKDNRSGVGIKDE